MVRRADRLFCVEIVIYIMQDGHLMTVIILARAKLVLRKIVSKTGLNLFILNPAICLEFYNVQYGNFDFGF